MAELEITAPGNPRLKGLLALRRRRARDRSGTTLVEGYEELRLALDAGVVPRAVYHCPDLMLDSSAQRDVLDHAVALGSDVVRVGRAAFERTAYREGPDGFLAEVPTPGSALTDLALGPDPLVLVCEGIEKPGNLGAMLRTADAAGVDAVVAVDPVTDWGNPNLVRASKGTVFSVDVATTDLPGLAGWLQVHRIRLVATTPDTERLHTDVDLTGSVALAVGAEKHGLTDDAMAAASDRVRIPMAGLVNSLNVATSAAIVVYEAIRQRG